MNIHDVPTRYRKLYQRAMTGRSAATMIRAHCLMCCGWVHEEVELCTYPLSPARRLFARGPRGGANGSRSGEAELWFW